MKAIMTLVMLGLSTAALADVSLSGGVGYRYDSTEAGSAAAVTKDRVKAELAASAKINDQATAVIGLRTGSFNSVWDDVGGAELKKPGLNLAYVDYAATETVKVTIGKFNQPWATSSSLFFDKDVKPEGLAVAYSNKSGLFANASSVTITEGGAAADSKVTSLQAGLKKNVAGLAVSGAVGLQDYSNTGAQDYSVQQVFVNVGTKLVGKPVSFFVDTLKNSKATTGDKALAYGVKFGNAVNPKEWDVTVLRQKVEANAQYGLWQDSDIAGGQGDHEGTVVAGTYAVAKGWKLSGKYFDTERGVGKESYKRVLIDANYSF